MKQRFWHNSEEISSKGGAKLISVLLIEDCRIHGKKIKKNLNMESNFKVDYSVCKTQLTNFIYTRLWT